MLYVLKCLTNVSEFSCWFDIGLQSIGMSILLVYSFNVFVSILPLFGRLIGVPAKLLVRDELE